MSQEIFSTMKALSDAAARRHQRLIEAAQALIDRLDTDENQHGGLVSRETLRAAGELRAIIAQVGGPL
jgi:hypothetical protein